MAFQVAEMKTKTAGSGDARVKQSGAIKIMIAEGHAMVRDVIKKLLEKEDDFRVVGEARNSREVLDQLPKLHPDVLLLDLDMRRESALDVIRNLNGVARDLRIMLLTGEITDGAVVEALRLGARGVIMKDAASNLLFRSIRAVMAGEYWIDRKSVADLVRALQVAPSSQHAADSPNSYGLTQREIEILSAIVDGYTNKEVAKKLSISEQTVKHHLTNIFEKVGVSNRLELALFAMNNHLARESS